MTTQNTISLNFQEAYSRLKPIVRNTPLQFNNNLSKLFDATIYLKREDLQLVRSYKLRGAYNKISTLDKSIASKGVVCASAGNHAQGFAYSCANLNLKGFVFMPITTPPQKISQTQMWGGGNIEIILTGDTFDDTAASAIEFCNNNQMTFIHPFDDEKIIEGQATVGVEIFEQLQNIDYLFIPIGGGGLSAGVSAYFKAVSPQTKIIGVEPAGAPSMQAAFDNNAPIALKEIDRFVDGAAVKKVGEKTFAICKENLQQICLVPEGKLCTTILELYNKEAIVVEPAGALAIAALEQFKEEIKGKTCVCIIGGGNNDIDRMQEIKERSLQYEGLKHYFLIRFAQRPGALKEFVNDVLGPTDDIVRFEYFKKNNKEAGPALVGIECKQKKDYDLLIEKLNVFSINYTNLRDDEKAFGFLV